MCLAGVYLVADYGTPVPAGVLQHFPQAAALQSTAAAVGHQPLQGLGGGGARTSRGIQQVAEEASAGAGAAALQTAVAAVSLGIAAMAGSIASAHACLKPGLFATQAQHVTAGICADVLRGLDIRHGCAMAGGGFFIGFFQWQPSVTTKQNCIAVLPPNLQIARTFFVLDSACIEMHHVQPQKDMVP